MATQTPINTDIHTHIHSYLHKQLMDNACILHHCICVCGCVGRCHAMFMSVLQLIASSANPNYALNATASRTLGTHAVVGVLSCNQTLEYDTTMRPKCVHIYVYNECA